MFILSLHPLTSDPICVTELAVYPMFDLHPQPQLFTPIYTEGLPPPVQKPHPPSTPILLILKHPRYSVHITDKFLLALFEMVMEFFISVRLFKKIIHEYHSVFCSLLWEYHISDYSRHKIKDEFWIICNRLHGSDSFYKLIVAHRVK